MKKIFYSTFILCLICPFSTLQGARLNDTAFIEYTQSSYDESTLKSTGSDDQNLENSQNNINTHVAIPIYKSAARKPAVMLLNFDYSRFNSNYKIQNENPQITSTIDNLHSLGFSLGSFIPLDKHLKMHFKLGGSFNTNLEKFEKIDKKDILTTGNMIFTNSYRNINYQYGISTSSKFGEPMILPVVGFTITPVNWFEYSLTIPHQTSAWFTFNRYSAGLFTMINGNQFRLIREDEADNYTVSQTSVETGISLRFETWENIILYTDAGLFTYRSLSIDDVEGHTTAEIKYSKSFQDNLFIRFGVAYNPF